MANKTACSVPAPSDQHHQYIIAGVLSFTCLLFMLLWLVYFLRYHSLRRTPHRIRKKFSLQMTIPPLEAPAIPLPVVKEGGEGREAAPHAPLRGGGAVRSSSRRLWKGLQQVPRITKSDLNLLQLIKAGKDAIFYQARMSRGTCKGHNIFTCKISKEGVRPKYVETEISIMRKLSHHKNILQLLDWNTAEVQSNPDTWIEGDIIIEAMKEKSASVSIYSFPEKPYILIMEYVSCGTLRTFLQTQRAHLISDPELQGLLTIASYHIALAVQHLHSKMIVHCDLALRNIMVNKFPWEVKVAEFGLARDMTSMASRRSYRWRNPQRVPLRWYPPEYFKNNFYSFKGDVWAFGIVLWEMQTFGTLPYPNLETSEAVVYHICIGHKNTNPEGCRPEILHIMHECWQEPYSLRPIFKDIVGMLETIMENDADYVDVLSPQDLVKDESEFHGTECLQAASALTDMNAI